ncbi:MAG: serine/threonine-protein kinase [Verrucomicrobiota bacterium]
MPDDDPQSNTSPSSPAPQQGSSAGATAFVPPTPEDLQAALPEYKVTELIGAGGMGAVYKATQVSLDRPVAIKILPSELFAAGAAPDPTTDGTDSSTGSDFQYAERFQREAQAMARLHHPRIIAVHDFGQAEITATGTGTPATFLYIVMEYIEGTDLDELKTKGTLTVDSILAIITQTCDALNYAHEKGIVHRDIKPANIMLDVNGQVKVADFGLAKMTGNDPAANLSLTVTSMAMGTPDYVAPEALEIGVEVDHRADIYSLGVMLYELLTGTIPRGMFQPPSQKNPDLDPRLDTVISNAMQSERDGRYQSVTELWQHIDEIRNSPSPAAVQQQAEQTGRVAIKPDPLGPTQKVSVSPATATKIPHAKEKKSNATLWFTVTAVIAVLLIVGGIITLNSSKAPPTTTADDAPPQIAKIENQEPETKTPPPTSTPDPPPLPGNNDPIDLLTLLDPANLAQANWQQTETGFENQTGSATLLSFPLAISGSYRIDATLTPIEAPDSIMLSFPVGKARVSMVFGGFPVEGYYSGLDMISGQRPPVNPTGIQGLQLEPGRDYKLEIDVRIKGADAEITVAVDDETIVTWSGPQSALAVSGARTPTPSQAISIFNHFNTNALWSRLSVTPTGGSIALLTPSVPHTIPTVASPILPGASVDLLSLVNPDADGIQGHWTRTEDGIESMPNSNSLQVLALPVNIEGNYRLRARFTPLDTRESTNFLIPVGPKSRAYIVFNGWPNHPNAPLSGIENIGGKSATSGTGTVVKDFPFQASKSYETEISVSTDVDTATVDVRLDGNPFFQWSGPIDQVPANVRFLKQTAPQSIAIANPLTGQTLLEELELTMTSGQATLLRQGAADEPAVWIDLLPLVRLPEHRRAGAWAQDTDATLRATAESETNDRLLIPLAAQKNYAVATEFTFDEKVGNLGIVLPLDNKTAVLNINANVQGRNLLGLMKINNAGYTSPNYPPSAIHRFDFEPGKRYQLVAHVIQDGSGKARIRATLDGQPAIDWSGPVSHFNDPGFGWPSIDRGRLGLGASRVPVSFHRVAYRELGENQSLDATLALSAPESWNPLADTPDPEPAETPEVTMTKTPPADPPNTNPAAPATTDTPPTDTPPHPPEGIDLFTNIDLTRDAFPPQFWMAEPTGGYATRGGNDANVLLPPHSVSGEYELEVHIRSIRQSAVTFPVGDAQATLILNTPNEPSFAGLEIIDGKSISDAENPYAASPSPVRTGQQPTVRIRVLEKSQDRWTIETFIDDEPFVSWEGDPAQLSHNPLWTPPIPGRISLGFLGGGGAGYISAFARPLMSSPPPPSDSKAGQRIAAIYQTFEQGYKDNLLKAHAEAVTTLNTSYANALERDRTQASAAGELERVLAIKSEIEAINQFAQSIPVTSPPELPPLPADPPASLTARRNTYAEAITKLVDDHITKSHALVEPLDNALAGLEAEFTREKDIDAALEVRQARSHIQELGLPFHL